MDDKTYYFGCKQRDEPLDGGVTHFVCIKAASTDEAWGKFNKQYVDKYNVLEFHGYFGEMPGTYKLLLEDKQPRIIA